MYTLVFDTETTGLPTRYTPYTCRTSYKGARLVSICWQIFNNKKMIKTQYHIIKPQEFVIPQVTIDIHGITNLKAHNEGRLVKDVLMDMYKDIRVYPTEDLLMVAHNISFDKNILLSEIHRCNIPEMETYINKLDTYCTKNKGVNITNIKRKDGRLKYPKLIELYNFLFPEGEPFNQHNAIDDTTACAKCYFKMTSV